MAAKVTKALTTGMKVLGGGNVPAYTLEHLSGSRKHPAGTFETIIIPYIELGRDGSAAVSYGDDMATVSRKHAAIERRGDDIVIKNLSSSNPTLVNGRPVKAEYFLNNGDEIQLSMEGPRLRFNRSATGTAKMGVTKRMNLVMQQAVRPYRAAVAGLAALIVVITGVGGTLTYYKVTDLVTENEELVVKTDSLVLAQDVAKREFEANLENMRKTNDEALAELTKTNSDLSGRLNNLSAQNKQLREEVSILATAPKDANAELVAAYEELKNHVYYLEVTRFEIIYPDGQKKDLQYGWSGTGFLTDDGRFVTARHCVQGWRFEPDGQILVLNTLEQAGAVFNIDFRFTSPTKQFTATYKDFVYNDKNDDLVDLSQYKDMGNGIARIAPMDRYDWAYIQTNETGGLKFDKDLSLNMKAATKVFALGFTQGYGSSSTTTEISPMLGEATVGQTGVTKDGNISVTSKGWGGGNSGGPVLTKRGDDYVVVGIVSWGPHIKGDIGFLVPMAEVK
jgi:pSer/pThr/pTyr-binding forkhead associated (FHA) protein